MELDDHDVLLDFEPGWPNVDDSSVIEAAGDVGRAAAWSYDEVGGPVRAVAVPTMPSPSQQYGTLSTWIQLLKKDLTWNPKLPCDAADEAAIPPIVRLGTTDSDSVAGDDDASCPQFEVLPIDDLDESNFGCDVQTQRSSDHPSSLLPASSRSSTTSSPIELDFLPGVKRFAQLEVELEPVEPPSIVSSQAIKLQCVYQLRTSPPSIDMSHSPPRSPTETEMDAFFGYKPSAALSMEYRSPPQPCFEPDTIPYPDLNKRPPNERNDTAPRKIPRLENFDPGGTIRRSEGIGSVSHSEVGNHNLEIESHALGDLKSFQRSLVLPVELQDVPPAKQLSNLAQFQLRPIGRGLQGDARRRAIIDALEQLTVSVFAQLVQLATRIPSQTAQPKQTSTIRIVVANRDKNHKKKTVSFPRNIGRESEPRLGGRELASVMKVVEYILDGFRKGLCASKRDFYYRAVELFEKQKVVDEIVDDIAATLCIRRSELGVGSSPKGLFSGQISLLLSNAAVVQGSLSRTGTLIPPIDQLVSIRYPADTAEGSAGRIRWVLVVEKEAIFSTLSSSALLLDSALGPGVVITGKGYPDMATRHLLKKLSADLPHIPVLALVDADPHGIEILATYACGSKSLQHEKEDLVVDRVECIGVKHIDLHGLCIDRRNLIELSARDRKKALSLLKRSDLKDDWKRELQHTLHRGYKAEIEIIGSSASGVNDDQGLLNYVVDRVSRTLLQYT